MINLERLAEYPIVSVDTETTGLNWARGDSAFGIAMAVWDGKKIQSHYWDVRDKPHIINALKRELPKVKRLVNHHVKFDVHMLRGLGIRVPLDRIECTMVRAALINEHQPSFSLDALALAYVGRGKEAGIYEELAQMFGGKPEREVQMKNLHRAPERLAHKYAVVDAELAIQLWQWQEEEIERQELQKVWSLEKRLTPVLVEIEEFGVRVDEARAHRSIKEMGPLIDKAQATLNRVAGKQVNANSAPQMRALFKVSKNEDGKWVTDGGFDLDDTDGGEASLGKKVLQLMADRGDKRAEAIIKIRKLVKAQSFLTNHILEHAVRGRVYPNYNQTRGDNELGTGTGRFSINDPALQQIPARDTDIASIVRACFLPEPKCTWGCSDWEQFEFRWFAHYTKDEAIIKAYAENPDLDYHQIVSEITGIPRNAPRAGGANAKQINLGLVFGMGEGEMAYQMGLDYTTRKDDRGREWKNAGPQAKAIFATYHSAIPGVKSLLQRASSVAASRGYVKTAMERHIRFPGRKFTHKAGGLTFQGTSADCMKVKMIALHEMGKKLGFHYLLSVHDEHDTSLPVKEAKSMVKLIKAELEAFGEGDQITCRVPIRSSTKTGANWWEACKKG